MDTGLAEQLLAAGSRPWCWYHCCGPSACSLPQKGSEQRVVRNCPQGRSLPPLGVEERKESPQYLQLSLVRTNPQSGLLEGERQERKDEKWSRNKNLSRHQKGVKENLRVSIYAMYTVQQGCLVLLLKKFSSSQMPSTCLHWYLLC